MTFSRPAWRLVALAVAAAFFWLALRADVYHMTSPVSLSRTLFGVSVLQVAHPWWLSLHVWVRKAYSIVAFTLAGLATIRALGATSRPALRAAAIVAAYSLGIEIAQRIFVAPEPVLESAFDVGCGALGGWLAHLIDRHLRSSAGRRTVLFPPAPEV